MTIMKIKMLALYLIAALGVCSASAVGKARAAADNAAPKGVFNLPGKYHPGHYIYTYERTPLNEVHGYDLPGVKGIIRRYQWRLLEPRQGVYDFSTIREDLDECRRYGKQLIILILDKSFAKGKSVCPSYLDPVMMTTFNGTIPYRWTELYIESLNRLTQALGKEFDADPNFEGINLQESSLAISNEMITQIPKQYAYSPEKYAVALERYVINTQKALPNSRVFWFQNFLAGGVVVPDTLPRAFIPWKVVMGGPDILPFRKAHSGSVYPKYDLYFGQLPLCCSIQPDSYHTNKYDVTNNHPHKHSSEGGFTPLEDLFLFGRDTLHCNYIIWAYIYVDAPDPSGGWTFGDALKVIEKYPEFHP